MQQYIIDNPSLTKNRILENFKEHYTGGCRWCGKTELPPRRKTFCSNECVDNYMIRISTSYMRKLVFKRDKGICSKCSTDTKKISRQIYEEEKLTNSPSSLRETYKIGKIRVKRNMGCWEANHIVPCFLNGGLCDLSNIETLCKICHLKETAKQVVYRKNYKDKQQASRNINVSTAQLKE